MPAGWRRCRATCSRAIWNRWEGCCNACANMTRKIALNPILRSMRRSNASSARFAAAPRELTFGEDRVEVSHTQAQAALRRVEIEVGAAADRQAVGDRLAGGGENAAQALGVAAPEDGLDLADDLVAGALLDEIEVEMAAAQRRTLHLAGHPHRAKGFAEKVAHLGAEARDGVRFLEEWQAHARKSSG